MATENQLLKLHSDMFPRSNIHSFVFSNPFSSSTMIDTLTSKSGIKYAKLPQIPANRVIFQDSSLPEIIDYSTLRHDTLCIANGIWERFGKPSISRHFGCGSCTGPVVLIHLPNCVSWSVIALGFLAAGWTVTGINPASTVPELAHIIKLCEPRVIICHPNIGGEDNIRQACAAAEHKKVDIFLASLSGSPYGGPQQPGDNTWTTLLSDHELKTEPFWAKEADTRLALILWTSGTTGKSKGAMLTHRAVIAGLILMYMMNLGYSPKEQWIGVPPFYHILGLYNLALMAPCIGATITIQSKFDILEYLRLVTKHRATILFMAPPVAVALAKFDLVDNSSFSLKSVRYARVGGAPLSPMIIRQLWERVGLVCKQSYGMSELGGTTMFKTNNWEEIQPRLSSCGLPAFPTQIKICGKDGASLGRNRPGEIVVQSPGQMLGYLKNPEATAGAIHVDGVHSGDIGYIDDEGYLTISGRSKETIKYKGFQVSPSEIESVITSLSDVQEAAVYAVYSETHATELPIAYVVPRNSAMLSHIPGPIPTGLVALADVVRSVVEKNFIYYKRLRGGITFVSALPKTSSGKILRMALKDLKGTHVECYTDATLGKL